MYRSGSTLQYNIVRLLVENSKTGQAEGFFQLSEAVQENVNFSRWAEDLAIHVVKMHEIYPESERLVNAGRAKICYIYRDIRDVAVSLKLKRGLTFKETLGELRTAISEYNEVMKIPRVLVQKYETVMFDLTEAVKEMAGFLGVRVDPEVCGKIAVECSVERAESAASDLRRKLALDLTDKTTREIDEILSPKLDKTTLIHPNHISRNMGASGVWETQLSTSEKQAIMSNFSEWLVENKYLGKLVDAGKGYDELTSYVAGKSKFIDPVIGCVSVETPKDQWAYGAVLALNPVMREAAEYLIIVEVFAMRGTLGIGLLNKAEDGFLYRIKLKASEEVHKVYIPVFDPKTAGRLVADNWDAEHSSEGLILSIRLYAMQEVQNYVPISAT